MQLPKKGQNYRHYKGNIYTVIGFAHHTESEEKLVLYKPQVEPEDLRTEYPEGVLFARPLKEFIETLEFEGKEVARFTPDLGQEPIFVPKDGQMDFSKARWCPVINCVVYNEDKILLVKRSAKLRLYPNCWNGISGFLDDYKSIEEKVFEELSEELGLKKENITSIKLCDVLHQEDASKNRSWIIHALRVDINTRELTLNWEAEAYKWVSVEEALKMDLLPGFSEVIKATL